MAVSREVLDHQTADLTATAAGVQSQTIDARAGARTIQNNIQYSIIANRQRIGA